jgi:hypothetical protein
MNEWNIQSRARQCQACGKAFADKQVYHTLLLDEKQGYVRLDVCEACWKSQYGQGAQDRKGFVSCWQGVYELPAAAPPEAIKKETAEGLLRKVIGLSEPRYAATAYILAVMLERKRLLRVKEQLHSEGRRVFVYEHPKTGDLFTIPDPQLQLNQLEQVQRDVADLLEHGLPPEPGSETAAPVVASGVGTPADPGTPGGETPAPAPVEEAADFTPPPAPEAP